MSLTEEQLSPIDYEELYSKIIDFCVEKSKTIAELQHSLAESGKRFNELAEICNKKDELIAQLLNVKTQK